MRTSTTVEASSGNWRETVDFVTEAEKLGLDICWVAEAWGSEAPSRCPAGTRSPCACRCAPSTTSPSTWPRSRPRCCG
ncbi:hypothetical protein QMK30_30360 [Streptomyces sp. H27-C3]|nr:hypothetical protein [Streptomyces sp. H27-C3]MDJ0465713.1 hypothetical protein [Streptomyces sp. H27-C3]